MFSLFFPLRSSQSGPDSWAGVRAVELSVGHGARVAGGERGRAEGLLLVLLRWDLDIPGVLWVLCRDWFSLEGLVQTSMPTKQEVVLYPRR